MFPYATPGLVLDSLDPWKTVYLTRGDLSDGWTDLLQFSIEVDPRVRVIDVAVWRLVRTDGAGPNVTQAAVEDWFGERRTRLINRVVNGGTWSVTLDDWGTTQGQPVDRLFAQCPIDRRVQFRLKSYQDVQMDFELDDIIVDEMDREAPGGDCGAMDDHLARLQQQYSAWDAAAGVQNVFIPIDLGIGGFGQQCQEGTVGWWRWQYPGGPVIIPTDRVHQKQTEGAMGAPYVLAHELAHAAGYGSGHCGAGGYPACSLGPGESLFSLMATDLASVGTYLSPDDCLRLWQ